MFLRLSYKKFSCCPPQKHELVWKILLLYTKSKLRQRSGEELMMAKGKPDQAMPGHIIRKLGAFYRLAQGHIPGTETHIFCRLFFIVIHRCCCCWLLQFWFCLLSPHSRIHIIQGVFCQVCRSFCSTSNTYTQLRTHDTPTAQHCQGVCNLTCCSSV